MVSGEEREETLGIKQAARQDRTDGRPSTPPTDRLFRNASLQSVGIYVVVHVSQSFIHVHDLITLLLRIALHVALHRRLCLPVCFCFCPRPPPTTPPSPLAAPSSDYCFCS